MSVPVTLPALGESVQEGTITRWLKQEGEAVKADEPLLEISTDKVDTEIPAPASGTLLSIKVGEDETVAVGTELAVIGEASEQPAERPAGEETTASTSTPPDQAEEGDRAEKAAERSQESADSGQAAEGSSGTGAAGVSVRLPELGESVSEGTVTRWLKQQGEHVEADEPLLEISTDKVDTEIPAPASGTLLAIKVEADETVAVGTELAVIGEENAATEQAPQPQEPEKPAPSTAEAPASSPREQSGRSDYADAEEQQVASLPPQPETGTHSAEGGQDDGQKGADAQAAGQGAYVTPLVRKLAAEHGVDLAALSGTGVGGRIRKQDVLDAARSQPDGAAGGERPEPEQPSSAQEAAAPAAGEQPAGSEPVPATSPQSPAPGPAAPQAAPSRPAPRPEASRGRTEKMSRLRRVIATRMVESLQASAQLTTVVEVDITRVARLRQRSKQDFEARQGTRLSYLPFFAVATVEALKEHPKLNATLDSESMEITYNDAEHLGIAVDTERGLLVPVIRDAGDLNIGGLARKIADLAERTRSNKIAPDELGGGTFTLTNTGSRGALFDTPILNQPQVGILGTGAVVKRPVVVDDPDLGETIAVRSMVYLALTYDHRLVDGADAARFLVTIKQRLEDGDFEAQLRG